MQVEQLITPKKNPFVGGKLALIKGAIASRKSTLQDCDVYFESLLYTSSGKSCPLRTGTCLEVVTGADQNPMHVVFIAMINTESDHTNKMEVVQLSKNKEIDEEEEEEMMNHKSFMIERGQIISIDEDLDDSACTMLEKWSNYNNRKEVALFIRKSSFGRDQSGHKKFMLDVARIMFERSGVAISDEVLEEAVKPPVKKSKKEKKRARPDTSSSSSSSSSSKNKEENYKKRKLEVYVDGKQFDNIYSLAEHYNTTKKEYKKEMTKLRSHLESEKEEAIKARQEAEMKVSYYKGIMLGKGWEHPL